MTNLTHNPFFCIFIPILYMIRAASCSSSGESIVSIQVGKELPDLHTRRSPTQSDTYQMLYRYNWFSWWWARGCSKHVENWNKYIEKRIVRQVFHLKELYRNARSTEHKIIPRCSTVSRTYNYTKMQHGQQNIKFYQDAARSAEHKNIGRWRWGRRT
jgi:hypothetical protein